MYTPTKIWRGWLSKINLNEKSDTAESIEKTQFGYLKCSKWDRQNVTVFIPEVHHFSLCGDLFSEDYVIGDRSRVETVELGFDMMEHYGTVERDERNAFKKLSRFFEDLNHATALPVSYQCLQMFSTCEVISQLPPFSKHKCLTSETVLRKWELLGTSHLLRSSPELETLTLKIIHSVDQDAYLTKRKWEQLRCEKGDFFESRRPLFEVYRMS